MVTDAEGLAAVAEQLLGLLDKLKSGAARTQQLVDSSRRALTKLTERGGKERLSGLQEITGIFRPLLLVLSATFIVSVVLIGVCILSPMLKEKQLAVSVLGSMAALSLMCSMIVFTKSLNVARELAHNDDDDE